MAHHRLRRTMAAYPAVGHAVSGVKSNQSSKPKLQSDQKSRQHQRGWPRSDPAADLLSLWRVAWRESGSGQLAIGLPQRVAGASGISPLSVPGARGSKCRGPPRFTMMIVSQCFRANKRKGC